MTSSKLVDQIESLIFDKLRSNEPRLRSFANEQSSEKATKELKAEGRRIAEELVREAMYSGILLDEETRIEDKTLRGGNTSEYVGVITNDTSFVFKLDTESQKLAKEGVAIRQIKGNTNLPLAFREAWPQIFALRTTPPYAYLMEFFPPEKGWVSLEDRLYPKQSQEAVSTAKAVRYINSALDLLFSGYTASLDVRLCPNISVDYLSRIRARMTACLSKDSRFDHQAVVINGEPFENWSDYLRIIEEKPSLLSEIGPGFSTVVHGDPNPGNILLKVSDSEIRTKLIDPKEWVIGDYLFDVCKITHFIEATGCVEKKTSVQELGFEATLDNGVLNVSYHLDNTGWEPSIVAACLDRVRDFATKKGDLHWEKRYQLGMASNLLGLAEGRLKNRKTESAFILFAEGLKWLKKYCSGIDQSTEPTSDSVCIQIGDAVIPDRLDGTRKWVSSHIPQVKETFDRRGFQLQHWAPERPNEAGKPIELSLEHEARLAPTDNENLQRLIDNLHASDGKEARRSFLDKTSLLGNLMIKEYERDKGPQSVDWYFDNSRPEESFVKRMYSLRKRIRSKSFMTWSAPEGGPSALNLELPFVAYGSSGLIARLEFNWIDDLEVCFEEYTKDRRRSDQQTMAIINPLNVVTQAELLVFDGIKPKIEHTTFREKFGFFETTGQGQPHEVLVINIDHIVAQSLETGQIGSYTDVDLSSTKVMTEAELLRLRDFTRAVATTYKLKPNYRTKAYRDFQVTGVLG